MEQLKALLSRRLMGVPAWVWGLALGGAIVAYAYISRRGEETEYGVPDETIPYVDDDSAGDAGDIEGTPSIPEKTVTVTTNTAWVRYVSDRLVASGEDPVLVNNALTKALAGITLTAQERAIWNIAVQRYGSPPEGAPPIDAPATPIGTNPPTVTPPKPKPPTYKGPARRKALPENPPGKWDKGKTGWKLGVHSNFTAEYRGNYVNVAPPNSAEEKAHVASLRLRNASHGGPQDKPRGRVIYLPPTLG